jgi:hypothetical protein
MHLKLSQCVWAAVHACVVAVAGTWILENLHVVQFSPDEYSLRHIALTSWYATLVVSPAFTLLVWLRVADANERYATYITSIGFTYEVSLTVGDSGVVTFDHVMRPPLPWIAILGIVPTCTKFIVAVTFYVLTLTQIHRVSWTLTAKVAAGAFLTLFFLAIVGTLLYAYRTLYQWSYSAYHAQVQLARRRALTTQRQKATPSATESEEAESP